MDTSPALTELRIFLLRAAGKQEENDLGAFAEPG
jgi:hypothetical protein